MAKNLLNNEERLLLIEKYKEDKLNNPPSNIKDETLILNYGTDEQKARSQVASATKEPKATENKTASPSEAVTEPTGCTEGSGETVEQVKALDKNQDYVKAFNEYVDLHLKMPVDTLTTEHLTMLNEQKRAANAKAQAAKENAAKKPFIKPKHTVTIVDNKTKKKIVVPRFTWDRFISKDGTHTLQADTPLEVQNI